MTSGAGASGALLLAVAVALVLPSPRGARRRSPLRAAGRRLQSSFATLQRRRSATRTRAQCIGLLEAFAAELRAGRPASTALQRAAQPHPGLVACSLGALRLGGDVAEALEADSRRAGAPVLRRLAACWRVGEGTGAGLAAAVTRIAAAARESERVRLELAARIAEPRSTMRVLALLPAFGLVLGTGLGADTVGWLTGTGPGRVVLVAGLLLDLAGVLWARRLVAGVEAAL